MSDKIYYCTNEDNDCPKKEQCKRFLNVQEKQNTTLFKNACNEDNNYVLFIEHIVTKEESND